MRQSLSALWSPPKRAGSLVSQGKVRRQRHLWASLEVPKCPTLPANGGRATEPITDTSTKWPSYPLQICTTDPESTTEMAGGSVLVTGGPFGSNVHVIVEPGCGTRPRFESKLAALS
jgi:hypothetical protein